MALFGMEGVLIRVECDASSGLPEMSMVGFLGAEVKEAGVGDPTRIDLYTHIKPDYQTKDTFLGYLTLYPLLQHGRDRTAFRLPSDRINESGRAERPEPRCDHGSRVFLQAFHKFCQPEDHHGGRVQRQAVSGLTPPLYSRFSRFFRMRCVMK